MTDEPRDEYGRTDDEHIRDILRGVLSDPMLVKNHVEGCAALASGSLQDCTCGLAPPRDTPWRA